MVALLVRAATGSDLAAVAALAAARRREALAPGPAAEQEAQAWAGLIAAAGLRPGAWLLVLDTSAGPGGYAVASVVDGLAGVAEGAIADVYVVPALRRRGGGAALVQACEARLRAAGCPSAMGQVPAQGAAAQALAARLGYGTERVVLSRPVP